MNKRLVVSALAKRRVPDPVFENGDTALFCSDWAASASDSDGNEVRMAGRGTEVLRRQPDGSWLCVIGQHLGHSYGIEALFEARFEKAS